MSSKKVLLIFLLLIMWTLATGCKRKNTCPKYCIPCKYKGPIIEILHPKEARNSFVMAEDKTMKRKWRIWKK
ncbi:unnamed protein product [Colias eurytheme]|nr:unnamed protein product [Colias eurytheme]